MAGTPQPVDGPVSHVERSPISATRTEPGDYRDATFFTTLSIVENMMAGKLKYDTEKARIEQYEKNKPNSFAKKLEKTDAQEAVEKVQNEVKNAADKAKVDLAQADIQTKVNKMIDDQEKSLVMLPLSKDCGRTEGRPFQKYLYLDSKAKHLIVDASLIADQFVKKLTVYPYSTTNPLVATAHEDQTMKSEALSFLSLMFVSPTFVCTPGLYAFMHHRDNLLKDNKHQSSIPSIISTGTLYRYYRAMITAVGGHMKIANPKLYKEIFMASYKEVITLSEVRTQRMRASMRKIADKYSFSDITYASQSNYSLSKWISELEPGKGIAKELDDLMFRFTVFHINAMELFITKILCIEQHLGATLCTPMIRPLLSGHLNEKESESARLYSYNCIMHMFDLYQRNHLKSGGMIMEANYWLQILEKEKDQTFISSAAPVSIDGVTPRAFYFIRMCAWLRMSRIEGDLVIND